jgi:hypothetical protein
MRVEIKDEHGASGVSFPRLSDGSGLPRRLKRVSGDSVTRTIKDLHAQFLSWSKFTTDRRLLENLFEIPVWPSVPTTLQAEFALLVRRIANWVPPLARY